VNEVPQEPKGLLDDLDPQDLKGQKENKERLDHLDHLDLVVTPKGQIQNKEPLVAVLSSVKLYLGQMVLSTI